MRFVGLASLAPLASSLRALSLAGNSHLSGEALSCLTALTSLNLRACYGINCYVPWRLPRLQSLVLAVGMSVDGGKGKQLVILDPALVLSIVCLQAESLPNFRPTCPRKIAGF